MTNVWGSVAAETGAYRRSRRQAVAVMTGTAMVVMLLAACGSGKGASSSPPATAPATTAAPPAKTVGTPEHGGTVRWAEAPDATPNYIFPLTPDTSFSTYNSQLQYMLYRPLYWFGQGGSPTVDYDKSVGQKPVVSDGGKVATITLNDYTWSDGEKVNARDVVFWMNLLKAEKKQWADYTPGLFPDNVASTTMPKGPSGNVVKFTFTKDYNPTWLVYNELSQVTPLPIAWDRTSAAGTTPTPTSKNLPDMTTAGATKVFNYLNGLSKKLTTYVNSPVWSIVDGPWTLSQFTTQGNVSYVPNKKYTGTDKPYLSKFIEVPYTTDTSEFDAVQSSASTDQVGYVPSQDIKKLPTVEKEGYKGLTFYPFAFNYMVMDFKNPQTGPLFKQLYIRQALQDSIDQAGWIKAYYEGLAAPTYGPVPVEPPNPFASTTEKSNPYPFSTTAAQSLLKSHGWTVSKSGSVCSVPAKCGAGITKGQKLSFTLDLASGSVPLTDSMQDYKSVAAESGIELNVVSQSFDTVIGNSNAGDTKWQMANWGGGWVYAPDYYPSGESIFSTGAGSNSGSYSDSMADKLINATTTVPAAQSESSLTAYQNYLAKQLPVLYQPAPATEALVASNLGGTALTPNAFTTLDPEDWYYVKK